MCVCVCDARPVHLIITMIKWFRTSRLSISCAWQDALDRTAPEESVDEDDPDFRQRPLV